MKFALRDGPTANEDFFELRWPSYRFPPYLSLLIASIRNVTKMRKWGSH